MSALPWFRKLVAVLATATFIALGVTAIATQEITLGGRLGINSFSGVAAERVGFGLLPVSGVFGRVLYSDGRYRKLIDAALIVAWAVSALVYFLALN